MKRIFTTLVLLLLLLPMMAQKPFKLRVVPGKDYPYYIYSITAKVWELNEENLLDLKESVMQRDAKSFFTTLNTRRNGHIDLQIAITDPQNEEHGYTHVTVMIPLVAGEEVTVTLHDIIDHEFTGSRIYREYGQAFKAVCRGRIPLKDYVAKHRKEPGCALFAISSILVGNGRYGSETDSLKAMFDSTTYNFLAKDKWEISEILCPISHELERNHNMYNDFISSQMIIKKDNNADSVHQLDRDLEGQTIIDTIATRYKGKPTLICISTFGYSSDSPDGYELLMHATGMNLVYLTSLANISWSDIERKWRERSANSFNYPGDHHLLMRYQVDSLFNLYMPHVNYEYPNIRCFYLLLDAEGKMVAKGDLQHDYTQLISIADRLKAQAGLPPFKGKPFKQLTYLDVAEPNAPRHTADEAKALQLALRRMTYSVLAKDDKNPDKRYYQTIAYDMPYSRSLGISRRLYDWVKEEARQKTENSYQAMLEWIAQKAKQKDDYKPDMEQYRKDIAVGKPVDLGLSVMWADMNLGAKSAEEAGMYFAWGDPEPIIGNGPRSWRNYRWSTGSAKTLRKYNTKTEHGPVDMRTTVQPEDDAATQLWQGDWRMPTIEEMEELRVRCSWEQSTENGVKGYRVTGPNGNSIFLPAAGCLNFLGLYGVGVKGYYWTSTLSEEVPNECYYLAEHINMGDLVNVAPQDRYAGRSIRPVCKRSDN